MKPTAAVEMNVRIVADAQFNEPNQHILGYEATIVGVVACLPVVFVPDFEEDLQILGTLDASPECSLCQIRHCRIGVQSHKLSPCQALGLNKYFNFFHR